MANEKPTDQLGSEVGDAVSKILKSTVIGRIADSNKVQKEIDDIRLEDAITLGGPKAVAHELASQKAKAEGHQLIGLEEAMKANALELKGVPSALEDAVEVANNAIGPKSGQDSRAEWDAINKGHFVEAGKQLGHLTKDSAVELTQDIGAGVRAVEKVFGASSPASQQPDPTHPAETPTTGKPSSKYFGK